MVTMNPLQPVHRPILSGSLRSPSVRIASPRSQSHHLGETIKARNRADATLPHPKQEVFFTAVSLRSDST
jgi:hypothetical protein